MQLWYGVVHASVCSAYGYEDLGQGCEYRWRLAWQCAPMAGRVMGRGVTGKPLLEGGGRVWLVLGGSFPVASFPLSLPTSVPIIGCSSLTANFLVRLRWWFLTWKLAVQWA